MADTRHLTRYWAASLAPQYAKAKLTPASGQYGVRRKITPAAYRGLTHTLLKTPAEPLGEHLRADVFQPLTVASSSNLVPPRPCFAPFPTNTRKRKMNAVAQKKTGLQDNEFYRVIKLRLHPNTEQAAVLRSWMAAKRAFYNQAVDCINHSRQYMAREDWPSFTDLRAHVREIIETEHPWASKVSSQITAGATAAAWAAYETNLAKLRTNQQHRFRLQMQSLKRIDVTPTEVFDCGVPGPRSQGVFKGFHPSASFRIVGGSRMDAECRFGGGMPGTIRVTDSSATILKLLEEKVPKCAPNVLWDKRTRRWYIAVKQVVQRPADTKPPSEREVLALDPGARKFNAFYRPDGTHGELLKGAESYIQSMCRKAASLQSKEAASTNHDTYKHYREQKLRTFAKLRNWTRSAHYEAIHTVFTLGDFIILPLFESQRMVRRSQRVFGNETAQKLYTWSHYSFSQRLYSKVQTTANKQIAFTREPGTSKTCDCCGHWVGSLGGAETFRCGSCGYTADRDHHGARGNLLAALGAALGVGPDGVDH